MTVDNKEKRKIMILGAGTYQVPLISKAKEMGLYTIVVSPGDYPGMALADKVIDCDIMDEEGVLRAAREERIDGIISDETDMPLLSMAYVSEKLGLPGNSRKSIELFNDKLKTRETCKALGIPTIEFKKVSGAQEAKEFMEALGSPAIIKPSDSEGSKGVVKVNDPAEIDDVFREAREYSRTGEVLIERFIEGRELEVDDIVLGGEVKTLMYADLESFENVFASTTRLYPSVKDPQIIDRLLEMDREIVKGLGLRQGLTHNEYILDKDDNIYLVEAAPRGGGTYISTYIAQLQTGLSTSEFLINIALGDIEEIPEFETGKCHSGYVAFYIPEGEIVSVAGKKEVEELPYVVKTTMEDVHVGMKSLPFHDKRQRHAIILYGESREELNERIDHVRKTLKIQTVNKEGKAADLIWK